MVACWEHLEQNQVLAAFLHTEHTSIAWSLGLRSLIIPGPILPVTGAPYDHLRNQCCQAALEGGFRFLFFVDSDCVPPRDAILRLMKHNLPLVSGIYHRRSPPHGIPVMMKPLGRWMTQYPSHLFEVDVVGAGCLLIRRDVLEAFVRNPQRPGKPFFDWRVDMVGHLPQGECLSEDFTFCTHARRLGIKTMVDPSIQCRHIGLADAVPGAMIPCNATP